MADCPPLSTRRFNLRPLQASDAAALFPTLSDDAQCEFLTRPAFASEEELWGWLADPDWNGRTWIAVDTDTGAVAARLVAMPAHEAGISELGWITVDRWQRKGVASETVPALIAHLFGAEDHRKLIAEVDAGNTASKALLQKTGFTREALFREHETTHAGLCDVEIWGLLRSDLHL